MSQENHVNESIINEEVKEFLEKEDRETKELLEKLSRVDTPSARKRSKELLTEIKDREEALAYYEV